MRGQKERHGRWLDEVCVGGMDKGEMDKGERGKR